MSTRTIIHNTHSGRVAASWTSIRVYGVHACGLQTTSGDCPFTADAISDRDSVYHTATSKLCNHLFQLNLDISGQTRGAAGKPGAHPEIKFLACPKFLGRAKDVDDINDAIRRAIVHYDSTVTSSQQIL